MARVKTIADRVPPGAETFLLAIAGPSWDKYLHDDAAWVALSASVPTVNGRYGNFPPGYPLRTPQIIDREDRAGVRADLDTWLREHGGDPATAVLIEVPPRPAKKRARTTAISEVSGPRG